MNQSVNPLMGSRDIRGGLFLSFWHLFGVVPLC